MSSTTSLINFYSARAMMNVFDFLYKMGVEHAHYAYSDDDIKEFVERTSAPEVYGILTEPKTFDSRIWKSRLYFWILNLGDRVTKQISEIIKETYDRKSVYSCFLPISFKFYTQGMIDRLQIPIDDGTFAIFKGIPKVLLKDLRDKGLKANKINERMFINMVQSFAYELADLEEEVTHSSKKLGNKRYVKFAEIFWSVVAAFRTGQSIARNAAKIQQLKDLETIEQIGVKSAEQIGVESVIDFRK